MLIVKPKIALDTLSSLVSTGPMTAAGVPLIRTLPVKKRFRWPDAFELSFQRDCRSLSICFVPNPMGIGDMRDKAIPALTLIVAAGLIGVAQARLPRPIRVDRDRVNVTMSAITRFDTIVNRRGARLQRFDWMG